MKTILTSSRRVFVLALVASALAFVPAVAKADSTVPVPTTVPSAIDYSLLLSLALAAYGL